MHILLIIYFTLFLFLSIKNLKLGIYWVIFTLPAYLIRFEIFDLPMTLLEVEILLLFLVWLIKNIRNIKNLKINKEFLISILAFIFFATISVFVSPNLTSALGIWKAYFIEPILFFIIFITTIKKENLKNIFYIFGAQILILSLFAIYQKFTGAFITNPFWQAEATRRVTSIFPYPNALALYLAPLVVLFLSYFIYKIKNKIGNWKLEIGNYLEIVSCILGFVAIYFTDSKGALIAIFVGIIFYAIFFKGKKKIFIATLLVVILFSAYLVSIGEINLKGTSTVTGGDSVSTRLGMWSETWQMLKTKPILGAGLVGYQTAVAPFHEKDYIEIYLYPHNIFLNFWTEIGLLGLLSFLTIIICFYFIGFKNSNKLSVIIMASMTTLLIHGLVDVPYFKNDLSVLFWVIIGMLYVSKNISRIK